MQQVMYVEGLRRVTVRYEEGDRTDMRREDKSASGMWQEWVR